MVPGGVPIAYCYWREAKVSVEDWNKGRTVMGIHRALSLSGPR